MSTLIQRLRSFFGTGLWDEDLNQLPIWRALPLRLVRSTVLAVRGYLDHQLAIRAAALTYITVLSLVPMLAFAFSVAKGFGLYDRLIDDVVIEFLDASFGPDPAASGSDEAEEVAGLVPDELEGTALGDELVDVIGAGEVGGEQAGELAADVGQEEPGAIDGRGAELQAETELSDAVAEAVEEGEQAAVAGVGAEPSESGGQPENPIGEPAGEFMDAEGGADGESPQAEGGALAEEQDPEAPAQPSQIREAIDQVLAFVEKTDASSLGAFGLIVLFAAVLRLLGQVEAALNMIWGVDRPRAFLRKLTDYLAMVVVAPILALTATAAQASGNSSELMDRLRDTWGVGGVLELLFGLGPLLAMWLVFTLLYLVMPNTRVRPFSAVLGGFVAAMIWSLVQELYVKSQVGVSSYNQLYAGFAAFPLFLLWAYLSWMSVLIGAEFGYADQSQAAYRRQAITRDSSPAYFEAAALSAVARITERFERGAEAPSLPELVDAVEIPEPRLRASLDLLSQAGLLVRTGEEGEPRYALGRAADRIRVFDVLVALRGSYPEQFAAEARDLDRRVAEIAHGVQRAERDSEANLTLRELVTEPGNDAAPEARRSLA